MFLIASVSLFFIMNNYRIVVTLEHLAVNILNTLLVSI